MRKAVHFSWALLAALTFSGCGGTVTTLPAANGGRAALSAGSQPALRISGPHPAGCATATVFVRLDTEIRGFPLFARGVTSPCVIIAGANTQLQERGALAIGRHGELHSLSFQADRGLTIHAADAAGDVPPIRAVGVAQDHVALAVDSRGNDFVVASEGYAGDACWFVVADGQTHTETEFCDSNLEAIHALAVDARDELIAIGTASAGRQTRIDIFAAPASAPQLVRSIGGPATGLPALGATEGYFDVSYSLVTDPRTDELYVYSSRYDFLNGRPIPGAPPPSIAEFSALARGNAAPVRVLSGAKVPLVRTAFSVNVLGADDRGDLYVFEPGPSLAVSVYGPGEHGNAMPERRFNDPTAAVGFVGASIGVRTSSR